MTPDKKQPNFDYYWMHRGSVWRSQIEKISLIWKYFVRSFP